LALNKTMKKILIFSILLSFALSACGGSKKVAGSDFENLALKNILASHEAAEPEFKTLAARMYVVYEDDDRSQGITVSMRMEKDKAIWMKAQVAGLVTVAKVLITPDRVQFYESINSQYFDGDFALLSDFLGTKIDFEKAQAILLGQSIFDLDASKLNVSPLATTLKIEPKTQSQNFIYSILLNASNFKVASANLSQPQDNRLLSLRYGDYEKIEDGFYPSSVELNASEKEKKTKVEITYRKIDLNVPVNFAFDIPEGYEKIDLK